MSTGLLRVALVVSTILVTDNQAASQCYQTAVPPADPPVGHMGSSIAVTSGWLAATSIFTVIPGVQQGSVQLYQQSAGGWILHSVIDAPDSDDNFFGGSLALTETCLAIGAYQDDDQALDAGAVYIYELVADEWLFDTKLYASDPASIVFFGFSIDLSGNHLVVGAPLDSQQASLAGAAYLFSSTGGSWIQEQKLAPTPWACALFGWACAIDGDVVIIGAPNDRVDQWFVTGKAYAYRLQGTSWNLSAQVTAPNPMKFDNFGQSVDTADGITVVGAPSREAAFVYSGPFAGFPTTLLPTIPAESFGSSVAAGLGHVVVGASSTDVTAQNDGIAFLYSGPGFSATALLMEPNPEAGDLLGGAVASDGPFLFVSAPGEDAFGPQAGTVHVFNRYPCIGATLCPGVPNSTGSSATLLAAGTADASDSSSTLFATGIPANQMAMLIVGRGTVQEAVFGSQGTLCLGGSEVARYLPVAPAGPTGFFLKDVSHAGLPFGVPVSIQAGSTWNFQVWYRDMNPDSTSNLSSALSVTFH